MTEIERAWEQNRAVEDRDRARAEIITANGGAIACPICRRASQVHTLDEARACLAKIESGESYCRLTGPRR